MNNLPPKDLAQWVFPFLEALRETPIVSHACKKVGISRSTAYNLRKSSPWFHDAWDRALDLGIDQLEQRAWEQAAEGDRTLLMFLLKSLHPAHYRGRSPQPVPRPAPVEIVLTQVPARADEPAPQDAAPDDPA